MNRITASLSAVFEKQVIQVKWPNDSKFLLSSETDEILTLQVWTICNQFLELQLTLEATKEASSSDINALKDSFSTQKHEFKAKIDGMDKEIAEVNQKYNLMESQLKNETKDRLELEKMLEQEIKQKQQLEVRNKM